MWNLMGYAEDGQSNKSTFWSMLGYKEKEENKNANVEDKEQNECNIEGPDKVLEKTEENVDSIEDFSSNVKDKKKKKEKMSGKEDNKKKKKKEKNMLSERIRSRSPLLSDMSSVANYCTSDNEENSEPKNENVQQTNFYAEEVEYNKDTHELQQEDISSEHVNSHNMKINVLPITKVQKNGEENDDDTETKNEEKKKDPDGNETDRSWFPFSIKHIIEPAIDKDAISELITTNYRTFNQANAGLFDMFESLLLKTNVQDESQSGHKNYLNSYVMNEETDEAHYNFVNNVIRSVTTELTPYIEAEAVKMVKIYSSAYNEYKNEIDFRDDVYQDILNEASEYATLVFDEKKNRNSRVLKIDFLILMNLNSDNYRSVIGSQNVATPKMKLEELFKITVASTNK